MTKHLGTLLLAGCLLLIACDGQAPPVGSPLPSSGQASGGPSATPAGPTGSATPSGPGVSASAAGSAAPIPPATPSRTPAVTPTGTPTPAPPISEFPQSWTGTWQDPVTGGSGSLELTLTGKDAEFGGSITMDGTACLSGGILDGAYDGRDIGFVVTQRGVEMRFAGTARDATITGTFASGCDGMDGTWTVERSSR